MVQLNKHILMRTAVWAAWMEEGMDALGRGMHVEKS